MSGLDFPIQARAAEHLNWSTKAPLPTPQQGVALAAGTNGRLYAIGGSANGSRDVAEYNSQTNTWTSRASVPIFRLFSAAATDSTGIIYVIGGLATGTVQAYNPSSNSWSNRASLPYAVHSLGAATGSNGKIYAVGGICGDCPAPGATYEYDPTINVWAEKSTMPIPVYGLGLVATNDGKIYAISGEDSNSLRNVVQEYDINTDTWTRKADLPTKRYLLGAATLPNGKIYAVGGRTTLADGQGTPVEFATVESYDPTTDTWASENPMSSARGNVGVVGLDGVLYAVGGFDCHFTSECPDLDVVEAAEIDNSNQVPVVGTITVAPVGNIPLNTSASFSASFTDADILDTHTATWNWGDSSTDPGTVTESSGSGSVTDSHTYTVAGNYTVTLTISDGQGSSRQSSVSVVVGHQLTSLTPAQVWVGLKNSDAVGIKFDLKAEVYKDGVLVTSGQLDSVPGGSSGFGNANLSSIPFASFSPVDFATGSNLSVKVSARNACVGSGKNSGTARLWFNDSAADSQFGATITPTASDYYLLDGFSLGTSAGPGPKKNIDVAAGAKCSPFKAFGTWQVTP